MSNFNSDKLYILPCTQEKLAFGSFDNENKSGRPQLCFSNQKYKFAVNLGAKMDNRKKGKCVGDTDTSEICTWDNMLSYEGPQKKNCKPEEVWGYITSFVNKSNAEIDEKKQESTKNYFIVSHHNTLKKSILKDILTSDKKLSKKEKTHIANCTCFLLENENNIWHLTLIYDGFPDKDKYNYFQLSTSLSPQKLFPNETSHEEELFYNLFKDCVDEVTVIHYTERGGDVDDLSESEKIEYAELCVELIPGSVDPCCGVVF